MSIIRIALTSLTEMHSALYLHSHIPDLLPAYPLCLSHHRVYCRIIVAQLLCTAASPRYLVRLIWYGRQNTCLFQFGVTIKDQGDQGFIASLSLHGDSNTGGLGLRCPVEFCLTRRANIDARSGSENQF
jgi:hypothetical protein